MPNSKISRVSQIVRSPGGGLLSFTTGSQKARRMLGDFFSESQFGDWSSELESRIGNCRPFGLIGIPSDCGGGICRGAAHGPLHLREQMFRRDSEIAKRDLGDIPCIPHLLHDVMLSDQQQLDSGTALWGTDFLPGWPVSPLNLLEEWLVQLWDEDPTFRPLVFGGDHSISGAVFCALDRADKLANLAVLQLDAHTDLLESRFGVRNCFATWTAHAVRKLPDPSRWIQMGIRASGFDQEYWESKFGLKQFWADRLIDRDPIEFAKQLVSGWKQQGCDSLYISHDIDGIDCRFAPSTGTPEANGLLPDWTSRVLDVVTQELPLIGADLPEVAPVIGSPSDGLLTVNTALELIDSLHWI